MDPDSSSAQDTPVVDTYGFDTPDALDTELTPEAEQEYVDKVLGVKGGSNEDKSENPEAPNPPTGKPADAPADGAKPDVPTATPVAAPPAPEEKPAEKPEEAPVLDTSDLWVDVENREGKVVRITLEDGVPDDFTFKNDKSLYEVMDAINEMRSLKASREADIEKFNTEKSEREAATKSNQDVLDGWNTEMSDLMDAGVMEKPKAPPANGKEYTSEEIAADPALQEMNSVFDFMKTENAKRNADGKSPVRSYGTALTLMRNSAKAVADADATKKAEEEQKAADDLVKKRGALVGGTSSQSGNSKGYVYKRGSAKNIYQVPTDDI